MTRRPEDYEGWIFYDARHSSVQCPVCKDYIMVPGDVPALLKALDDHERDCWGNHAVTRM